jgi:vancomycin permeability regulator SanA
MFKKNIKYLLLLVILFFIVILAINSYIINFSREKIINISEIENYKIWLVLWASVRSNWEPSDILADRLKTSYEAYKSSKISKIIVSWDNMKSNYNEPDAMKAYLVKLWVKEEDIFADYAWFDTYDSMYRAKEIFSVNKLVIFTQEYHLYRALYISNKLWIDSVWVISDKHKYLWITRYKIREVFSIIKAFIEVEILKPETKYKKDIKIEIK